jgi:hypothetical protein
MLPAADAENVGGQQGREASLDVHYWMLAGQAAHQLLSSITSLHLHSLQQLACISQRQPAVLILPCCNAAPRLAVAD